MALGRVNGMLSGVPLVLCWLLEQSHVCCGLVVGFAVGRGSLRYVSMKQGVYLCWLCDHFACLLINEIFQLCSVFLVWVLVAILLPNFCFWSASFCRCSLAFLGLNAWVFLVNYFDLLIQAVNDSRC